MPQRITLIDSLRGYALMGLFLVHMVEYFELYWYQPVPSAVNETMFFLFGGKAYALFALLFGVSFFIIMDRQARRGVDFRARFVWRLVLLLAMGYAHGLIYGGDILQILAVTGLLLVPLYARSSATVLCVAMFFILQVPALLLFALVSNGVLSYSQPLHPVIQPAVFETYAHGSFGEVLRANLWQGQLGKWTFMLESGRFWNIAGLSMLGFLLARMGFFTETARYRRWYTRGLVIALVLAVITNVFREDVVQLSAGSEGQWIAGNVAGVYGNNALLAVTVLGLILLYQLRAGSKVLGLLAPCGRMSLTIYVSQSILLVPFFYGFGAGAYAFIGQPVSLVLGLALWCVQVWLAHVWFRHYQYGPTEWAWRAATWLRTDIPFRKRGVGLTQSPEPV